MQGKFFVTLVLLVFLLILWLHTEKVGGTSVCNNCTSNKIDLLIGHLVEIKDTPVIETKSLAIYR